MQPKAVTGSSRALKGRQTAFNNGAAAAKAGRPESACPYTETSGNRQDLNFGRTWRSHWLRGHRSVKKEDVPLP